MELTKYSIYAVSLCAGLLATAGCRTGSKTGEQFATRYRTTDGRIADIGPRMSSADGWSFKEPHMDKCWIAKDFDFRGYDTLVITPTLAAVQAQTPQEGYALSRAQENLVIELNRMFLTRNLVTNVVTQETELPSGAHALKLKDTIIEFKKGSFAGREWAGLFGGGQPVLRVSGKMTDGDKTVFTFEARRSGVSAGAHLLEMPDETIQLEDIRSMALDITDFAAAIAGEYRPKN